MIIGIMIVSCYLTRRRGYSIQPPASSGQGILEQPKLEPADNLDLASSDDENEPFFLLSPTAAEHPKKQRQCFGLAFQTPNSSRFANYWHSRFIQKYPFLVEMFYWAVSYVTYLAAKAGSELLFSTNGVWEAAQQHGLDVLAFEHAGIFSFFPLREVDVQQFFMNGHQGLLTILNRAYSLVHIPATVR